MPTNQNAYNTRLTDEALEKRFRDTFRSQGGAELVDDLYASGVIIPVVDFTAAAEGSQLGQNLQTAWDFSTGNGSANNSSATLISNSGFWLLELNVTAFSQSGSATMAITDGLTSKPIWKLQSSTGSAATQMAVSNEQIVVFLRSGDSVTLATTSASWYAWATYRQIADVSGNLTNPSGFTSS